MGSDSTPGLVRDRYLRPLHDLRISVTDRCNFRCTYCMPKEVFHSQYEFLQRSRLLTFEELERMTRLCVAQGVRKVRLTGGEPLLRRDLPELVRRLSTIPGIEDLCLTTNGSLLTKKSAEALAGAGLHRVTVSLDSLDDEVFSSLNDVDYPVQDVLRGIREAEQAGLGPIKINMVIRKGVNESQILPIAEYFRGTGTIVRYIEFMDVGSSNHWCMDAVMPAEEVVQTINERWPLEPAEENYPGEVARRWRYQDGQGEIGTIASVTQPFCGDCSRLRLAADGRLYTCLFATEGKDFRELLRNGAEDTRLQQELEETWRGRQDRYSELRGQVSIPLRKMEMSYLGG